MGFCCCLVSCLCFFAVFVFCFFKSNTTYIWCFLESQFRLIYKTLKHWRTSDARIFALHIDEVWECLNLALRYWSLASMIRGSAVELFWMQPGSFGESAFKARIARWWKIWCSRQPVAHTLKKTENYIQYISCHRLALHSFSLQRACRIGELHCQSKTTWNDVLQVNENVPLKAPSAEASPQRCFVLMILMIQMREWLNLAFGTFGCWLVACFGLLANLFAGMCVCVWVLRQEFAPVSACQTWEVCIDGFDTMNDTSSGWSEKTVTWPTVYAIPCTWCGQDPEQNLEGCGLSHFHKLCQLGGLGQELLLCWVSILDYFQIMHLNFWIINFQQTQRLLQECMWASFNRNSLQLLVTFFGW